MNGGVERMVCAPPPLVRARALTPPLLHFSRTRSLSLLFAQWVGYIKDYDGGTLMECILDPHTPYTG